MIVTSNKSCAEWGDVLATAILDRLLHHCDVILSYPDTLASLRARAAGRRCNSAVLSIGAVQPAAGLGR
jgi:DNA replication protein DnaC